MHSLNSLYNKYGITLYKSKKNSIPTGGNEIIIIFFCSGKQALNICKACDLNVASPA